MKAIIIDRQLSKRELEEVRALSRKEKWEVYSADSISGIKVNKPIQASFQRKKEINYETFDWVIHFGERKIAGEEVKLSLRFDNTSLWFYHKFRTYFYVRNLWYFIDELKIYCRQYEKVRLYTSKRVLEELDAIEEKVEFVFGKPVKKKLSVISLLSYSLFFVLRVVIGFFQYYRFHKREYVIIDRPEIYQPTIQIDTLKTKMDNNYLAYLMKKGEDTFCVLDDVGFPKLFGEEVFRLRWRYFVNMRRKRRMCGEIIYFSALFDKKIRKQLNEYDINFHQSLDVLKKESNDDLEKIIIGFIGSLRSSSKLYLFKYLSYKKYFKGKKFKSITTVDENSPLVKSILDAAKLNKIKTIGIQHGAIHELHPSYNFALSDYSLDQVPDLFFIWGRRWLVGLLNPLFNSHKYVLGQLKTDIIKFIKDNSTLNSKREKVILFASQPQRDYELRVRTIEDILSVLSAIKNVRLIIKPHPSESTNSFFQKPLLKYNFNKYEIVRDLDLYDLLNISDIVLTSFSTVGTETAYFGKPLVIIDYLDQDIQSYFKFGIAFKAQNRTELKLLLDQIINRSKSVDMNLINAYLKDTVHQIDGAVSERCLSVIRKK